ncbi:MAG: Alpha/beta hydrolase [Bryobacterales bacterium]|nr:Alpha/beta hydrolase [Bryobacterales bacterium]
MRKPVGGLTLVAFLAVSGALSGQESDAWRWAALFANRYSFHQDLVYGVANNIPLKLDVWGRHDAATPVPTVIYIHGGGWVFGAKAGATSLLMPYLQKGWNAVNVEYRMAGQSLAPAAVVYSRCALRCVSRNAQKYHFDTNGLVLTGHSAGGHLALTTGMMTTDAGLDDACPGDGGNDVPLHAAAIVNWYGITDVADLLSGQPEDLCGRMAGVPNQVDLAARLSPLSYIRKDLPPVITIHWDHDPTVPYSHAVRLREALDKAAVPNQLITIPGGVHGEFNDEQTLHTYTQIWKFLGAHMNVLP